MGIRSSLGVTTPAFRPTRVGALLLAAGILGGAAIARSPAPAAAISSGASTDWEVPVTPSDLITKVANNSPQLAADPTNPRFVVIANRLDWPDFGCALQESGSGGRGWLSATPVPKLPPGVDKCYAPEVAFDGKGRLFYLFIGLHGPGNEPAGAFLTTSDDRGRSFTPPRQVLGPLRFMVRMALDPSSGDRGRLHLVWVEAGADPPLGGFPPTDNPIMSAYSDDGGETFSGPLRISAPNRRVVAPAVTLGPGHRVHVLYYDLEDDARDYQGLEGPKWDGRWSLRLASSADGGRHYSPGAVVDDDVVPPERIMLVFTAPPPSLAVDGEGRLFAAWYDARSGDWDVWLRRSADGGRTWSGPQRLNDDPVGDKRDQYLPRLSVAPTGRIDAVWYDRRGNVENRGNDVYFTYSTDGGATFAANLKVTSLDSDSRIGPIYDVPSARGLREIGSRLGLLSDRGGAVAAWTDTRNTGRSPPSQDIFAARVRLDLGDGSGAGGVTGAVLSVGALAILGAIVARRRLAAQSRNP